METTLKNPATAIAQTAPEKEATGFWATMEFNRFGILPILLLIIGCVGGIAAGFGAFDDLLRISLVAFPTIISLALVLAVAPMRVVFFSAAVALICDVIALAIGYPQVFGF